MSASYRDTSRPAQQQAGSAYPSIPTDNTRTPPADWQRHQTGVFNTQCDTGWLHLGGTTATMVHTSMPDACLSRSDSAQMAQWNI